MTRLLFTCLILGLFFYSCSTTEQTQESLSESNSSDETVDKSGAPSWYNHDQRASRDSLEFTGTGMAIASDSVTATEKSSEQARKYLLYAIDSYAEDVRRDLTDASSNSDVSSERFILSLRQAIQNMQLSGSDLTIEADHSTTDEGIHRIYTRMSIDRKRAIDMLASAVGHDQFSESLKNETPM